MFFKGTFIQQFMASVYSLEHICRVQQRGERQWFSQTLKQVTEQYPKTDSIAISSDTDGHKY